MNRGPIGSFNTRSFGAGPFRTGPLNAAGDRRLRPLRRAPPPAHVLLARWQQAAMASGWFGTEDWWTPGVEALARAVAQQRDIRGPCAMLGTARASDGFGVRAAVADLFTLYRQARSEGPPNRAVRCLIQAWAEQTFAPVGFTLCGHPQQGAAERHLRALLDGLYQLGGDASAPLSAEFTVLIVELADPAASLGWEPVIRLLEQGNRLAPILPAHALLVALSPGRVGTIARRCGDLAYISADLHTTAAQVPADLPSAYRLLAQVTR